MRRARRYRRSMERSRIDGPTAATATGNQYGTFSQTEFHLCGDPWVNLLCSSVCWVPALNHKHRQKNASRASASMGRQYHLHLPEVPSPTEESITRTRVTVIPSDPIEELHMMKYWPFL